MILFAIAFLKGFGHKKPEDLLSEYMNHVAQKEYEQMYQMIDQKSSRKITKEAFLERNAKIYEGIEAKNFHIDIEEKSNGGKTLTYQCSFDTSAGKVSFQNKANFVLGKDGYKLVWDDSLIFPSLTATDKVRIVTTEAERGSILDRNGQMLAGKGLASSVGIVPGKLKDKENAIKKIASLLNMDKSTIANKLSAQWVKEDSFVPLKTLPNLNNLLLLSRQLSKKEKEEQDLQNKLLDIPGVMITDTEIRQYPYGEATAHLIGYVQKVTAEDLKEHENEGYHSNSLIGKSGVESLYEKQLKGTDGHEIYIVDENGDRKDTIIDVPVKDGKDIQLTIDIHLQEELYQQFQKDKSCSVAMDPYSGEVLAMISTPSFDNNDFVLGMSDQLWKDLNNDKKKPLYNRFRQVWCPGSTLKPITAAIGLNCNAIDPKKDYGSEGLSWQKDKSWGDYHVTTLHTYKPVTLKNALIYSDNIYFAKAALNIEADELESSLKALGFGEEFPFEIKMQTSQFSNNGKMESEIQLADSGYGQGQILINPLHLASLYSVFCNQGDVIQPRFLYKENAKPRTWIDEAFSHEIVDEVLDGLKAVVNDPHGTGYGAHQKDIKLAGKTGTAEIKASKEDTSGTELGWFAVFTTDRRIEKPILLISMVEDVKQIGGSGYVVRKDKAVLNEYLK
ncbi:MAG: penicillin-binding transpeptidase domain-containing protein [Lachnospiraceae bacterium]|nr:penicillin-binding transpeptidase domain-containing protein [Lachnospiraceae bacterium]